MSREINLTKSSIGQLVVGDQLGMRGLRILVTNIYSDKIEIDGNVPLAGEVNERR